MKMLKKIKVDAPKAGATKETVPVVDVHAVQIKNTDGTYMGVVIAEDEATLQLQTDAGIVTFEKSKIGEVAGLIAVYKQAEDDVNEAQAVVDSIKPLVLKLGVKQIINHNCTTPLDSWTSVKLKDSENGVARVSSTKAYPFANGDVISQCFVQLFESAKAGETDVAKIAALEKHYDINNYVQETTVAAFDAKFFLDEKGNFSQTRFDMVQAALEVVAKKLNVPSPVSFKTVVQPKPDFHASRYSKFTAEENLKLQVVLPNKVSVTPI